MKSKTLLRATPANVSRKLTQAGCQKRQAYASTVRGWKSYTSGFVCDQRSDHVRVQYHSSGGSVDAQTNAARLRPYREALEPFFAVEAREDHLRITTKATTESAESAPKNQAAVALARARWDNRPELAAAPTTIGGRLRVARLEKKWTLAMLGDKAGVKVSSLANYERDVTRCPAGKLARLASALGKTVELLTT